MDRIRLSAHCGLRTRHCVGVEALLRWGHPKFGVGGPGLFIGELKGTAGLLDWETDGSRSAPGICVGVDKHITRWRRNGA